MTLFARRGRRLEEAAEPRGGRARGWERGAAGTPRFGVGGAQPIPGSQNGDDSDGARKVPPARVGAPSKGIPPPGLLAPPGAYSAAGGRPRAAAVRSPPPPRRAPLRHAGVSPPPPSGASPRRKHAASTRVPDEGGWRRGNGSSRSPSAPRSRAGKPPPAHPPTRCRVSPTRRAAPRPPPVSAEQAGRGRERSPVTMAPAGALFLPSRAYIWFGRTATGGPKIAPRSRPPRATAAAAQWAPAPPPPARGASG